MSNANEEIKLIKYSPKWETLLKNTISNLDDKDSRFSTGIGKFSATKWSVRADCLHSILDKV